MLYIIITYDYSKNYKHIFLEYKTYKINYDNSLI